MSKNKLPQVTFIYDRYKKASPTRKAAIELRITYNYKQKYIATGVMLYPNQWDKGNIVNCPDLKQISQILDSLLRKVKQALLDMMEKGTIDIFAITKYLQSNEEKKKNFLEYCKERTIIRKYGKAPGSQKRYNIFLQHFEQWGKIIEFSDIKDSAIIAYDKYMENMKPVSRWGNYHKFLNGFILDAIKEEYLKRNPYKWVNIDKGKNSKGIERCLSPKEFYKLKKTVMPTYSLERVKDLFIFQTYTCLSYADLREFDPTLIQEIKGTKVYIRTRNKTSKLFTIPLLSPALEILDKYNNTLPIISNVKYNEFLKVVAQTAGIDKPISSHWARHTGATLLLNEGVPMQIVSKICGHSSTKITEQVYAKLLDETVVDALHNLSI